MPGTISPEDAAAQAAERARAARARAAEAVRREVQAAREEREAGEGERSVPTGQATQLVEEAEALEAEAARLATVVETRAREAREQSPPPVNITQAELDDYFAHWEEHRAEREAYREQMRRAAAEILSRRRPRPQRGPPVPQPQQPDDWRWGTREGHEAQPGDIPVGRKGKSGWTWQIWQPGTRAPAKGAPKGGKQGGKPTPLPKGGEREAQEGGTPTKGGKRGGKEGGQPTALPRAKGGEPGAEAEHGEEAGRPAVTLVPRQPPGRAASSAEAWLGPRLTPRETAGERAGLGLRLTPREDLGERAGLGAGPRLTPREDLGERAGLGAGPRLTPREAASPSGVRLTPREPALETGPALQPARRMSTQLLLQGMMLIHETGWSDTPPAEWFQGIADMAVYGHMPEWFEDDLETSGKLEEWKDTVSMLVGYSPEEWRQERYQQVLRRCINSMWSCFVGAVSSENDTQACIWMSTRIMRLADEAQVPLSVSTVWDNTNRVFTGKLKYKIEGRRAAAAYRRPTGLQRAAQERGELLPQASTAFGVEPRNVQGQRRRR